MYKKIIMLWVKLNTALLKKIRLNIFKCEYINREKRRPSSTNNRLDKTAFFIQILAFVQGQLNIWTFSDSRYQCKVFDTERILKWLVRFFFLTVVLFSIFSNKCVKQHFFLMVFCYSNEKHYYLFFIQSDEYFFLIKKSFNRITLINFQIDLSQIM